MKTKDFLGREWEIDCMGCAIVDGSMLAPGGLIQKTKSFVVHQDPLIPLPGFLVIASMRHIQSIADMTDSEYEEFASLVRSTLQAIKEVTKIEHLTIVQEERSVHFHLWFFPWTSGVVERYGSPSLSKIRDIMTDLRNQTMDGEKWAELGKTLQRIRDLTTEALKHGDL